MKQQLIGMLAETFIHPGSGRTTGAIDLPVIREKTTDYPYIPGSGLKGALLDWARQNNLTDYRGIFGSTDQAGQVLVADARLLLLPVRSLTGSYKWATCPHLLERLRRDLKRSGKASEIDFKIPPVTAKEVITAGEGNIFLEERVFTISGEPKDQLIKALQPFMNESETRDRLEAQLAILHDDDFAWFARYGLAVNARNALDENTKLTKPGALWYEETIAPDTLMYTILAEREEGVLEQIETGFKEHPYLQTGGNETVGQGWFALSWMNKVKGGAND